VRFSVKAHAIIGISLHYSMRKNPMSHDDIVTISPDIMSGTPVFCGTRVPIQNLLDYLKAGDSIDDFLDGFPTVSREQVIAFLDAAEAQMVQLVA
jgi:uncharacterized protein (DUF433 family)